MKHRRIFSLITAAMVVLSLAGCGNESEVPTLETEEAFVTESETETEQTSRSETEQTSETESSGTTTALSEETEVMSSDEIITEETDTEETVSTLQESDSSIGESREYELDLTVFPKIYGDFNRSANLRASRDELSFLDDEQYEAYLRAWILIDGIEEYVQIPCTIGNTHYLDENENIYDGRGSYPEYSYVSTYESFYSYLQTVFTQDGADEILKKYGKYFLTVGDELYMHYGEKGIPLGYYGGEYKLTESSDDTITFEYIAYYDVDGENWTITYPIKMINTSNGWRCELFNYLWTREITNQASDSATCASHALATMLNIYYGANLYDWNTYWDGSTTIFDTNLVKDDNYYSSESEYLSEIKQRLDYGIPVEIVVDADGGKHFVNAIGYELDENGNFTFEGIVITDSGTAGDKKVATIGNACRAYAEYKYDSDDRYGYRIIIPFLIDENNQFILDENGNKTIDLKYARVVE